VLVIQYRLHPGQTGFTEQPAILWKSLRLAEAVNSAEIGKNLLCTLIQDGHIGPKQPFRNSPTQYAPNDTYQRVCLVYMNIPVLVEEDNRTLLAKVVDFVDMQMLMPSQR